MDKKEIRCRWIKLKKVNLTQKRREIVKKVLFGFKRSIVPVPWWVFRCIVPLEVRKTKSKLGGLSDEKRKLHHFVVRELPRYGKPMPPEFISAEMKMDMDRVVEILDDLERRLIFLFRPGGREVVWAYPVTAEPTQHRIDFSSGEKFWAA